MIRLPGILPHKSVSRPRASMENSAAVFAVTRRPKSKARAAASKAGPRFAEVAGRNMRKGMSPGSPRSAISLLLGFELVQHHFRTGVQHHGRLSLRLRQSAELFIGHARYR